MFPARLLYHGVKKKISIVPKNSAVVPNSAAKKQSTPHSVALVASSPGKCERPKQGAWVNWETQRQTGTVG